MTQFANSLQVLERIGGDDGTRTRGLCRDRQQQAVLPFDNLSRDPAQEFFSEGLTEEMIAQLGKLNRDRLKVVGRSSVAKYKGLSLIHIYPARPAEKHRCSRRSHACRQVQLDVYKRQSWKKARNTPDDNPAMPIRRLQTCFPTKDDTS